LASCAGSPSGNIGGIKDAFENLLDAHKTLEHIESTTTYYSYFQKFGRRLGTDLPDQPPKETTSNHEMEQFLQDQINHVENFLKEHKTEHIQQVYFAGQSVRRVIFVLEVLHLPRYKELNLAGGLPPHVNLLKRRAKVLDIDISEELTKINNHESLNDNDIKLLESNLKHKLCTRRAEQKRSEIDTTRIITNDYWAISLARLPHTRNEEHAFLVLEGKMGNKSMIWFIDFVTNDPSDMFHPGARNVQVRKEYFESQEVNRPSQLLFQCRKRLMKIGPRDRLVHSTWLIPKPTAKTLIQNIEARQDDPPVYNILGDSALGRSTAAVQGKPVGHNCFTFARNMLRDLNDKYIHVPEDRLGDWLLYATTRNLVDTKFNNQWWESGRFTLMMIFLAGIVVAYLFGVVLKFL
jgi:hypothetical protein